MPRPTVYQTFFEVGGWGGGGRRERRGEEGGGEGGEGEGGGMRCKRKQSQGTAAGC